jgi:hypothetical protein
VSRNIPEKQKQVRSDPELRARMQNVHSRLKYGYRLYGFDEKLNTVFAYEYPSTYAYAVNVN